MKVLILSNSLYWGGLEVHAIALATTLIELRHDVTFLCFGAGAYDLYRSRAPHGANVMNLGLPEQRSPWAWWRALAPFEADAAILEKGTLWTGGLALEAVLRLKYRCYFAVQQLEAPPLPPRGTSRHLGGLLPGIGLWWYRWKLRGYLRSLPPRLTICVSDGVRRRFRNDYGYSDRRLVTIHNGVDPDRFRPNRDARAGIRREWGVPEDAFVFGSVGRMSPQKALDVAIRAFAQVVERCRDQPLYLVLIGDGEQRAMLAALRDRLGLERVVLLTGFASSPAEAFQGLDVFLIPSRYEGLPFALVEAMASGCIVIGSNVGGIPEAVTDSKLGTLVPPDDVSALADAMTDAVTKDAASREASRRAARQHVIEHFDLRAKCTELVALLTACKP